MDELWRTIDDFPKYEVSNCGRYRNKETGKIMKFYDNEKSKTIFANVCRGKRQYHISLARAVYRAFGDKKVTKHTKVFHLDGDYRNNRIENLICKSYQSNSSKPYHWKLIYPDGTRKSFHSLFELQKEIPCAPIYRCNKEQLEGLSCKYGFEIVKLVGENTLVDKVLSKDRRKKIMEFVHYVEEKYGSMINVDESDPKVIEYRKIVNHNAWKKWGV